VVGTRLAAATRLLVNSATGTNHFAFALSGTSN
jgi:hypothetical protein